MTAPTAPSPGLGEREAVARTEELTEKIAVWLKEANSGWWESTCLLLASDLLNGPLATLRTENETLRAERDAARGQVASFDKAHALQRKRWSEDDEFKRLDRIRQNIAGLRPGDAETIADAQSRILTAEAGRDAAIARAEEAERRLGQRPLTASDLAEALECFSNPVVSAMHSGTATECCIAQGMDAVAWRLREMDRLAALTTPEHPHGD